MRNCGRAADSQGTKGGTITRDLRGYLGVIQGLLRYIGTIPLKIQPNASEAGVFAISGGP